MKNFDNEIPKYIKKKESSVSKSKEKSNHKHEYVDCLFIINKDNRPHKGTYCRICGKIGDISFFELEEFESRFWRLLDTDEIFEKYKDLEKIYIEDIFQKYVVLNNEIKQGENYDRRD